MYWLGSWEWTRETYFYWMICPSSELARLSSGSETGLSSPRDGVEPVNRPPPARRSLFRALARSACNLSFCSWSSSISRCSFRRWAFSREHSSSISSNCRFWVRKRLVTFSICSFSCSPLRRSSSTCKYLTQGKRRKIRYDWRISENDTEVCQ